MGPKECENTIAWLQEQIIYYRCRNITIKAIYMDVEIQRALANHCYLSDSDIPLIKTYFGIPILLTITRNVALAVDIYDPYDRKEQTHHATN